MTLLLPLLFFSSFGLSSHQSLVVTKGLFLNLDDELADMNLDPRALDVPIPFYYKEGVNFWAQKAAFVVSIHGAHPP